MFHESALERKQRVSTPWTIFGRLCYGAVLLVRDLMLGAEALLALVRVVVEKHQALATASGQSFNLFAILGRA